MTKALVPPWPTMVVMPPPLLPAEPPPGKIDSVLPPVPCERRYFSRSPGAKPEWAYTVVAGAWLISASATAPARTSTDRTSWKRLDDMTFSFRMKRPVPAEWRLGQSSGLVNPGTAPGRAAPWPEDEIRLQQRCHW